MFINPSLVFQLFIYFILLLAINAKEMLSNCLLVVCSCCLCILVAFWCICGFRGVTHSAFNDMPKELDEQHQIC